MTQLLLGDITPALPQTRISRLLDIAEKMGYNISFTEGCVEPGYDDKPVALADWNDRTEYNRKTGVSKVTDSTMPRLAKLFEKLGFEIEWEDEWSVCQGCQKAVRTKTRGPSWKPYFWVDGQNCELLCGDCVKDDPADYLELLSGNPKQCLQLDIDLVKHGYKLHSGDYESGLYPGQNDNPKIIAEELAKEGIADYIFVLDSKGQFGIGFSVWVKGKK